MGAPRLTEVFGLRETPGTGGASSLRYGSPPVRFPGHPEEDDVDGPDPGGVTVAPRVEGALDEAAPGDPSVLSGLGVRAAMAPLGRTPWEPSRRTLHPGERRLLKRLDGVRCFVSVLPARAHSAHTGRGSRSSDGWMLDCEVRLPGADPDGRDDRWVFHVERRFATAAEAEAAQEDVMDFVDARSLRQLLDVPRSGPLHMTAWGEGGPRGG